MKKVIESVVCPLCGEPITIVEYSDIVREFGINNFTNLHGFIPVCYHCGSEFLMHDTEEEAIASIASIPKITERESFCINCRTEIEYSISQNLWEGRHNDVSFWYNELEAFCPMCGEEVYVAELNDINLESREQAYRSAKNEK